MMKLTLDDGTQITLISYDEALAQLKTNPLAPIYLSEDRTMDLWREATTIFNDLEVEFSHDTEAFIHQGIEVYYTQFYSH